MRDAFSDLHPAVCLFYFVSVMAFSAFTLHPVVLAASFSGAALYAGLRLGGGRLARAGKAWLPFLFLVFLANPAFTHRGVTVLFYLPTGNPVTAESALFGAASALLFAVTLLWLLCVGSVLDTDKWICLFGKIAASLSLLLSMTFRMVPACGRRLREVYRSQAPAGKETFKGKILRAVRTLSAVTTWVLEESVDRSDSMAARGYGLPGRTFYSRFRFTRRDAAFLCLEVCFCAAFFVLYARGAFDYWFYPSVRPLPSGRKELLAFGLFFCYAMLPSVMRGEEAVRWNLSRSGM